MTAASETWSAARDAVRSLERTVADARKRLTPDELREIAACCLRIRKSLGMPRMLIAGRLPPKEHK
jgi:hypothetical protein